MTATGPTSNRKLFPEFQCWTTPNCNTLPISPPRNSTHFGIMSSFIRWQTSVFSCSWARCQRISFPVPVRVRRHFLDKPKRTNLSIPPSRKETLQEVSKPPGIAREYPYIRMAVPKRNVLDIMPIRDLGRQCSCCKVSSANRG